MDVMVRGDVGALACMYHTINVTEMIGIKKKTRRNPFSLV